MGIRVAWGGERGLERGMGGWEVGAMVDIDIKRSSTRMGLGKVSDLVEERINYIPCRDRGRGASVLREAVQERADKTHRLCCPSAV